MLRAAAVLLAAFAGFCVLMKYVVLPARLVSDAELRKELERTQFIEPTMPKGDDWPQWRGIDRDGIAGSEIPDDLSRLKLAWKVPGGEGYSSFAVRGGKAWTVLERDGKELVVCLDLKDGKAIWAHEHEPKKTFDYGGPRSTPTLEGGRLFAVTSDGWLLCLDADKGSVVWEKDTEAVLPKWGLACSPLVTDGLVLVARGGKGRCLAAFDTKDGEEKWTCGDDEAGYSSPILVKSREGVLQPVFLTGSKLQAVRALDGKPLWEFPWPTPFDVNAATPLRFAGLARWRGLAEYFFLSSGYGKGSALVRLLPQGPRAAWTSNGLCCHFNSPVHIDGFIYGLDETRGLTCLDPKIGEALWHEKGFNRGSLFRTKDRLVAVTERGAVVVIEPNPEEYVEKGRLQVRGDMRFWAAPVLAEGMLLLRDRKSIFAYKVR